jgi:membrane-bound serine protease (ClpP class)
MNDIWLMIGLTVIGLLLIAVDFYLPGFVLGSIGIVLMLIAVSVAYRGYGLNAAAGLFLAEVVLGCTIGYIVIKTVPQTAAGKRMILAHEQTGQSAATEPPTRLVGQHGVAQSLLRPSGMALLDGKRLDVVAESGVIESGSAIKVVAVEGTQIIVRKI